MEYRKLGSTGLEVSAIGFGCSRIGKSIFEGESDRFYEDFLLTAFDQGINFFDTSASYTYGNSEKILGKTFQKKREQVFFATKVGFLDSTLARYGRYLVPVAPLFRPFLKQHKKSLKQKTVKRHDFRLENIQLSLETSLKRLRTDYLDLFQLHSPSYEVIESGDVFLFLEKFKKQGKIRYYGVSVNCMEDAIKCLDYPKISSLQVFCSLLDRDPEVNLFPLKEELNSFPGIIVKSPLSRGAITKEMKQKTGFTIGIVTEERRRELIEFQKYLNDVYTSLPLLSYRYLLDQPEVSTILTGTTNKKHLLENLRAIELPKLPFDISSFSK